MNVLQFHNIAISMTSRTSMSLFWNDCYVSSANRRIDPREDMRFKPAQNEHQGVVNARAIELLQEEPSLEETTEIKTIREHVVPARSGKLVELRAPSTFEDGVVLIIESP